MSLTSGHPNVDRGDLLLGHLNLICPEGAAFTLSHSPSLPDCLLCLLSARLWEAMKALAGRNIILGTGDAMSSWRV